MPTNIAWTDETSKEEVEDRIQDKYEINEDTGCWEWTAAQNDPGYGRIRIEDTLRYAHRVSFRLYNGDLDDNEQVNHRCHNPRCINPDHLYSGTQQENIEDARERGTLLESRARGPDHPRTVLTEDDVREIRRLYKKTDHTQRSLASQFDVSKGAIQDILERKTWDHIDDGGSQ